MHRPKCLGLEIPIKQRHWIAVRKVNDCFYNLDSKLDEPRCIGDQEKLITFLTYELSSPKTQLFLVVYDLDAKDKRLMKTDEDKAVK